jgi:hypothetical protein
MALARRAFLAGALLVLVPACGLFSSHHRRDANSVDPGDHRRVGVEVTSHNWNDITVYLVTGGLPQRLGMVTALSSASFDFPSHRVYTSAGVRLRALPVAGHAFTSETILVQPGQVITWTLENDLDHSSVTVY